MIADTTNIAAALQYTRTYHVQIKNSDIHDNFNVFLKFYLICMKIIIMFVNKRIFNN